jgi:hypothetical protein
MPIQKAPIIRTFTEPNFGGGNAGDRADDML